MRNTISLISMESICDQTERNLETIISFLKQASLAGATTVVFPELALTGYCLEHAASTAIPLAHPYIEVLRQCARSMAVTALIGFAEQDGDLIFNSQLVCGTDGSISTYRKTHLGKRESKVFTSGDKLPIFEFELPFGIAVCYDMHFPEVASTLKAQGAELILAPHATPRKAGPRRVIWAKYMPTRAYDNRLYVCCCNLSGTNGCGTEFAGGLAVYAPDGNTLAFTDTENILTVTLPRLQFNDANNFPAHRRPELYR